MIKEYKGLSSNKKRFGQSIHSIAHSIPYASHSISITPRRLRMPASWPAGFQFSGSPFSIRSSQKSIPHSPPLFRFHSDDDQAAGFRLSIPFWSRRVTGPAQDLASMQVEGGTYGGATSLHNGDFVGQSAARAALQHSASSAARNRYGAPIGTVPRHCW